MALTPTTSLVRRFLPGYCRNGWVVIIISVPERKPRHTAESPSVHTVRSKTQTICDGREYDHNVETRRQRIRQIQGIVTLSSTTFHIYIQITSRFESVEGSLPPNCTSHRDSRSRSPYVVCYPVPSNLVHVCNVEHVKDNRRETKSFIPRLHETIARH
jgi:hypothetical protein